ncbi:tannase/feruloyl esterase family alpha/beta hydrolase [Pseudorhodoferax sp. Leaf267]|uniref:tannase/feruloyl esterase family alpha/beta hydrolase n=1 Tax=Pseudorhodoferax sp. Leaf267 TaxID=1736316 RepID=UPI0006F67E24|nr:tannase/feruloyl esterase family alpha/beta hydrolase [Pseudorhodoferax sp. Leaf267]KQP21753.1 feruloyl esterase [Pseudorhodoferax sp. Leaf267]
MRRHAGFHVFRFTVTALSAAALIGCGGSDDNDNGGAAGASATAEQACGALAGKTVAGATVATAATVAASGAVPLYCKVNATIAPQLNLELRLPQAWNGKLHYAGGGGYNGAINPLAGAPLSALKMGYATVTSDSGHTGNVLSADFALNDTYAANLFGSLSVPTVLSSAREMVQAAYGKLPDKAYFEGCSNGGREGLMAAQRNPNLFDGIIARAPAYNWVGFMGQFNRTAKALAAPGGSFSAAKVATLAAAVRAACDAGDGIVDGVVANPQACTFDPAVLRCAGGADTGNACLSDPQLAAVASWTGTASWAGGAYTNTGWALTGNEDDPGAWATWVSGPGGNVQGALQYLFQDTTVKNYLARNRAQDSLAYTWDSNLNAMYALAALNDATNSDLRPLMNSSAKLILWHGGNDSALSYKATTAYYQAATAAVGGQAAMDGFARYYIAPGVNHCSGGPGADDTDLLSALDAWASQGTAPGTLTATKVAGGATQFTRPLCQYPQYPRYTGPANNAAAAALASNYTCTAP